MSGGGYAGFQIPDDRMSDHAAHSFLITQIINKLATTAVVKVVSVTNNGGVTPVGFVDVTPMVNQVNGVGDPTPHGVIHNLPYVRLQGGTDAIILDPKVGDIGVAVFCSRDISQVKRNKKISNPGSSRKFDWADGIYIGMILNGTPSQYVGFSINGISVISPTKVTVTAPNVELNGPTKVTVTAPIIELKGNVTSTGSFTNNGKDVGSAHRHLQSGGSGTGGIPV